MMMSLMSPRASARRAALLLVLVVPLAAACNPQEIARQAGATRRLSIATGGTGGVYYPYGGGVAKIISENLEGVEATAEVTAASVDNLKFLRDGKSDIAFTLADTLDDAVRGRGAFAGGGPVPVRALAVLYTNYTHLVTTADSGIASIAELKGRTVSTGAPGSGTEVIALRLLEAAGLDPARDLSRQALAVSASAEALKDAKLEAFFWSGGLPTAAVLDLAHTPRMRIRLVASDGALPALQRAHGDRLYRRVVIPASAYPGMTGDVPVVGVANLLVVHERMDEPLAHDITRLLFEKRADLAMIHPEASNLSLASAIAGSPAPFHPGAIRYYRDRKVWAD
jgi:TRAP transporter TAXI family solute receptor